MPDRLGAGARHNPFSSQNVQPGSIPYRFQPESGIREIMARLESGGMCGQIIGPHGSGKSTLMHSLAESLKESGWGVMHVDAYGGIDVKAPERTIILLDCAERMPARRVHSLSRRAKRHGGGLIVTAHDDIGLPTLFRIDVDHDTILEMVKGLLVDSGIPPPEDLIIELHEIHRGNLRLVLFELYDWYEALSREAI